MMTDLSAAAKRLTEVCRSIFGDESRWITADGYPDSVALSIIDSIYSTGSKYQAVINVVNEYRLTEVPRSATPTETAPANCYRPSRRLEAAPYGRNWSITGNLPTPRRTLH